jgi:hypothetical protein
MVYSVSRPSASLSRRVDVEALVLCFSAITQCRGVCDNVLKVKEWNEDKMN